MGSLQGSLVLQLTVLQATLIMSPLQLWLGTTLSPPLNRLCVPPSKTRYKYAVPAQLENFVVQADRQTQTNRQADRESQRVSESLTHTQTHARTHTHTHTHREMDLALVTTADVHCGSCNNLVPLELSANDSSCDSFQHTV